MNKEIDSHCIEELKKGSQKAFNKIYEAYAPRLYGFCLQYTKSREDSEELVHDLFVKLWQKREVVRNDLPLITLLFHMIRYLLINRFHARVNAPEYELYTEYCNDPVLAVSDTSQQVEYDDFCRQLHQLKQQLPSTQQQIVEYKIHQGRSNDEIAGFLHLSKQTVKNQLSLALKQLRGQLAGTEFSVLSECFANNTGTTSDWIPTTRWAKTSTHTIRV